MKAYAVIMLALALPIRAVAQRPEPPAYELLQTFSGLLGQIRSNYVDSVTTSQLVYGAIDGMLRSLDPHSRFMRHEDMEAEMQWASGELSGAGIALDDVEGEPTVVAVYRGGAADRAGILPGDRLRWVNDTSVTGLPAARINTRLLGAEGTRARLGLARGSRLEPDTFNVQIKYRPLEPHAVTDTRMLDEFTGYIRFQEFSANAGDDVEKAFGTLKKQGARQVVLDLRGNPGGFVTGAVEIGGALLPKGTLVFSARGRRSSDSTDIRTERDGKYRDVPLVVLIDGGTASAAEALAASLQDHDRALLMGQRSFGKALIQQLLPVPPNGDGVWLTVGYVVTPSGRVIQRRYKGLDVGQYYTLRAGDAEDTTKVYHTDAGRPVRGGGGIEPDVVLPEAEAAPVWWSIAADSNFAVAVADSVAPLLGADNAARAAWMNDSTAWRARLLVPFMARVRDHLHVTARLAPGVEYQVMRRLASRAAEVRWGRDARDDLLARSDADVKAAMGAFDKARELSAKR
ncbi:MAG TPA: S41 family peptidase [Gemmatimonadales bacterium]|nr:S41 family peptidase [Gemmatimonadales bacterium]